MSKSVVRQCLRSVAFCATGAAVLLACGTASGQGLPAMPEKVAAPAPLPPEAMPAAVGADIRDAVLALIHVEQCELLILPMDFTPGLPLSVTLRLEGVHTAIDLRPHSVRSDRFAVFEQRDDGLSHQVKSPIENTLRGEARGLAGSIVAGGVMGDGLAARIILDEEREFWIEPVSARVPGAPAGLHALYTRADLAMGQQWRCGGPELDEHNPDDEGHEPPADGSVRGATLWTAVMDTDADFEFYQSYGGTSAVVARISVVTNTMNLQYEREVNITHNLGTMIVRTTAADPYTVTDPAVLNAQIEAEWSSANRPGTSDVVQLFTARDIDSSTIGRANQIGSICLDGDSNCLSQSDYNGNFMSATDLSAHELGHLWDAVHCTCSGPASTMNPNITSINRFTFSNNQDTVGQINAYRATRGCLTTSTPGTGAPNDNCGDAITIGPGTFGFTNNNATTDGPTPTTCGTGNAIQEDVWYRFVAPCNGTMTVDTCGSNFDTVLLVYTGFCGSFTEAACSDDSAVCGGSPPRQSFVSIPVTFNTAYLIRVGGWNGANGDGLMSLSMTGCPAPSNNACGAATLIAHCSPTAFSTAGATTDGPIEAAACDAFGYQDVGSDVWFRYIAPCTGNVRVSLCGSSYDTKLAVYANCPGGPGATLACNDDFCGVSSQVEFAALADNDYYFRVGGYNSAQGTGTLTITNLACPTPSNDTCFTAQTVNAGATPFSTRGACSDGFISALCANDSGNIPRDVWYSWTAGCGGQATIDTCVADYDTKLAVYTTCPFGDQTAIACNDDACGTTGLRSRVMFTASAGTTYLLRVGGFNSQSGTGTLNIAVAASAPANNACASATTVTANGSFVGTLCGATNDGSATCGASATNPDIWFVFTGTCNQPVTFSTCGTHDGFLGLDAGVDTVLSVHTGICGSLTEIACNDDSFGCAADANIIRDSVVTVNVTQGTVYRIRVSKFGGHPVDAPVRLNIGVCGPAFCDADWCQDGVVGVPDIFCFLSDWFANDPVARNYGGTNGVPAIFAFLSEWFAEGTGPCP